MCHAAVLDDLIRELATSLLRRLAKNPSHIVQVLRHGTLPTHLRFAIKQNQPGLNPGQGFALKCGHFNVGVFGICFQIIQFCHNFSNRRGGKWLGRWMPISTQISTCKTLFFAVAVGLLVEGESSGAEFASLRCCNPGKVCAIATTSEGLLDLDTIAIHGNFCLGSS